MTEETKKVNILDKYTSKYETMLSLVTVGYIGATLLVILDGTLFILYPEKVPTVVDGILGTAWLTWTAGLFGWLFGKNGKD